ncbi:MAG: Asp-tRNA(Asn)/Glu-tRNA(Gln) amidotransferase subunit GatC [Limnochordales bacterium]|nr:Asp-tRNA(Asn)/Glu-tRNA(Gln) amidotransferase subunit GatC [Limnochordales bacterium]
MEKLSQEQVEHVARLARLALREEEKAIFAEQLGQILAYAAKIRELDLANVEPTAHVLGLTNVTRPDEVRPSLSQEEVLQNGPEVQDGYFRVPRIVEEG